MVTAKSRRAGKRAAKSSGSAWGNTPACVATYNILEGDQFLDQFEDSLVPFDDAGTLKVKDLRFFPRTTSNPNFLRGLAENMALQFLRHLVKTFTNRKEDRTLSTQQLIDALAAAFADRNTTLADIAATVDRLFKFPGEA
jgi:hypothetical protein